MVRSVSILALALTACVHGHYEQMPAITFDDLSAPGPMQTARIGGLDVRYFDAGTGQPVLLVHGLGEHAGYWNENVSALLDADRRVIVPDLVGHGRSAKPHLDAHPNAYAMTAQAARLAGLLDALKVERPVVLVGHSMGGQIALQFALAWPARVKSLVLLAPAGVETFTPGEGAWLKQVSTTAAFEARDEDQLREHYRKNVFGAWSDAAAHHLEERVRVRKAPDFDRYLYAVVHSIHAMLDAPVTDRLGELKMPVTVLFGAADGLIPNPILHGGDADDVAAQARRLMPRAEVRVLPDVGHMLQVEAPGSVNAVIREASQ